jgi:tRNA threonylcarbamoyladenosine biosynthesis protein TsaB
VSDPLIVLAIDTALNACSAAVAAGGAVLSARSEAMARGQAERLAPLVAEVVAAAGVGFGALDRVIVTTGPGSFTGVRVGLAFARSLGVALDRPCLGVSTLEALAFSDGRSSLRAACIQTPGALYVGAWRDGVAVLAPQAAERSEVVGLLAPLGHGVLVGPGAEALVAQGLALIPRQCAFADPAALALRAADLAVEAYPANPTYLRSPGATAPA